MTLGLTQGDPRSTSVNFGKKIVSSVLPGKSELVTFELNTADLIYNPRVFIIADEDYELTEVNRSNNIASKKLYVQGLEDEVIEEGIDLYLSNKDISFDGGNGNNVLLEGKTINLGINVSNIGTEGSEETTLLVKDGDLKIAELKIDAIESGKSKQIFIPWKPSSGNHEITIVVDNKNLIEETNENNNSSSASLESSSWFSCYYCKEVSRQSGS